MRAQSLAFVGSVALCLTVGAVPATAQEATASSTSSTTQLPAQPSLKLPEWTKPSVAPPSEAVGSTIPSFSQLFRSVGTDFKNLPSRENAILLTIGAGLAGLSAPAEKDITEDWTRPGPEDQVLAPGAIIGNSYLHMGAAFALYATGRATHNTRVGQFGADLVRAQIIAQSTTFAIKFAADRTRPNGEKRSFPSGHTSTMFATATVVQQHFGWKAGIPAYAAAAYVGASRIDAKKHYLSDVAFGAALGIIAGRTVTIGHRNMKFALTPMGGPGGGVGIGLTKVN